MTFTVKDLDDMVQEALTPKKVNIFRRMQQLKAQQPQPIRKVSGISQRQAKI
jgi:hypothetical protein